MKKVVLLPNMRKLLTLVSLLLLTVAVAFGSTSLTTSLVAPSRADELSDVTSQLNKQQKQLADLEKRQQQLSQDISSASLSLSQVSSQLTAAEKELSAIEKDLDAKENELAGWEADRDALVRELYKQNRVSSIEIIFSADDLGGSAHQFQYYNESLKSLSERIVKLAGQVAVFKSNRASAKKLRDELATLRSQYQAGLASSQSQLSSTSSQLSSVKSSIKNLSAKQEQLILAKFAATQGSETVGEDQPYSEPLPNPTFHPAYMVATYGYPHRIGMSQYGAYGRAKKDQSYKTILSAYYKVSSSSVQTYRSGSSIHVKGCSTGPPPWYPGGGWSKSTCQSKGYTWFDKTLSMESYIKGLGEMPTSWGSTVNDGMEALQAQAVAGRSYAWSYANGNGNTICPSTYCQVWLGHEKGSYWNQAVDATKNKVIMSGGAPLKAFYFSTAGGYTISTKAWISYWSYNDGIKDYDSASGKFYEQIANAPWYHTGWGDRKGVKGTYNPWMTKDEFADIFNAFLLCGAKNGSGVYELKSDCSYMQYLSPIDKGGWSITTVRNKLVELNVTPVTTITAVVPTFPSGVPANTATVYISGSHGTYTFSARYFRDMFNLRSRGTLQIPTYRFDFTVKP